MTPCATEALVNILVFNCGTSSVRFQVAAVDPGRPAIDVHHRLARGMVGPIGAEAEWHLEVPGQPADQRSIRVSTHEAAVRSVIDWCRERRIVIDAVGHRLVHGGERFPRTTLVDESVLTSLEILQDLSPLHAGPGLAGLRAARGACDNETPMMAVFDT